MTKIRWLLTLVMMVAAVPANTWAQQTGTVQGTAVDATTMQPLAGVQVSIQGTTLGSLTNAQGRFQILNVPAGQRTVRAQLIGYSVAEQSVTVPAGAVGTVNFNLQPGAVALEGVVVTALGIERQAREIGVATQQIGGDALTRVEPNIVNALSGKVSGVQIINAGPQGGSSRVVIRGASSVTGNNQPLFVIDGVIVDNSAPRLRGYGGFDYGNAMQDINPDHIESITILKGPNAAALYGSRAANGAILITTKTGRAATGGQVTASQVATWETPLRLPSYQNQFGQGANGTFAFVDGAGAGVFDWEDLSWGPPMDGRLIPQYNSPIDPATGRRVPTPFVPQPDNIRNFFDRGRTLTTNAAFAVGTDQANARLSLGRTHMNGMVPGHELDRISLGLSGGLQVSERLRTETSVQYITSDANRRPGIGYETSNPMIQAVWWGRQVDTRDLRARYMERRPDNDPHLAGMPYTWNYLYFPNPFYVQLANHNFDSRDRLIGQVTATYAITPWLSALVRSGTDWYQDDRRFNYAQDLWGMSGFDPRVGADANPIGATGAFGEWNIGHQETNSDFLLTANPTLNLPFSLSASVGGNRRDWQRNQRYVWVPELIAPGVYSVNNAALTPDSWGDVARRRINSLYGQTDLGFRDVLFLTFTGRNDWSSTLPEGNRSYFYPSVSSSFVFSDAFPALQGTPLEFGKLRASWARVGNDTEPYRLRDAFIANQPFLGVPRFTNPTTLANADLRPEQTESFEIGTEVGFLNGRVGLDLTYYTATTRDQIMNVQVSRASGYQGQWINAGAVRNSGVEVLLNTTPLQAGDFRWDATVNWARNRNTVVELVEGVPGLQIPGGSFWGVNVFAREGEPYGQMMGLRYRRNADGQIIVNNDPTSAWYGTPLRESTPSVIGNYNPNWRGGLSNSLSFRGMNLNFLLDMQQGGSIYSVTHMFGRYTGVLEETLVGRCRLPTWPATEGIPVCDANTGMVVEGVKVVSVTGTDTIFAPNDIPVSAQRYNMSLYNTHEAHIFDASYVKLREATLGFAIPTRFTNRMGIAGMNLQVVGRNLALWTDVPHIDPETAFDASNVQGLEFGQLPTARSIGFNVTIRP